LAPPPDGRPRSAREAPRTAPAPRRPAHRQQAAPASDLQARAGGRAAQPRHRPRDLPRARHPDRGLAGARGAPARRRALHPATDEEGNERAPHLAEPARLAERHTKIPRWASEAAFTRLSRRASSLALRAPGRTPTARSPARFTGLTRCWL